MGTWIELRCNFRYGAACHSNRNDGPMALSTDTVRDINSTLKKLRGEAFDEGWEMTPLGWCCPACAVAHERAKSVISATQD